MSLAKMITGIKNLSAVLDSLFWIFKIWL